MKIEELIAKYEGLFEKLYAFPVVTINKVLEDLKQLDEPQKVVVEQFVDDYIKHAKEKDWDLQDLFEFVGDEDRGGLREWFYDGCNQETLALAWIFGYEAKKEKRYTVVMKKTKQPLYYNAVDKKLFFSMGGLATNFTKKQLEEAGFGWVFSCPGVKIEEVE